MISNGRQLARQKDCQQVYRKNPEAKVNIFFFGQISMNQHT